MRTKLLFGFMLLSIAAFAQQNPIQIDANGLTQTLTAGGVVIRGQIVKINSAGQVVPVLTTDTSGAIGVAATSQTSAGNGVAVSIQGTPLVQIDASGCAAGNIVSFSTTTGGAGHCASTASGQQVGVAISISSPGSNFWNVALSLGSGGGGGSPTGSTIYAWDPKYGVKADGQKVCDATTTNTSNIVTIGANDPSFLTTAKVGQPVWVINTTCAGTYTFVGPATTAVAQTTITSVDSATQIHVGTNATASCAAACELRWGDDDTTALNAAWAATVNGAGVNCGVLVLPAGNMLVSAPIQSSAANNICGSITGLYDGPTVRGQGAAASILVPTPNFAAGSSTCFFFCASGSNQLLNFGLDGSGLQPALTQTVNFFQLGNGGVMRDVDIHAWGTGTGQTSTVLNANQLGDGYISGVQIFAAGINGIGINGTNSCGASGSPITASLIASRNNSVLAGNGGNCFSFTDFNFGSTQTFQAFSISTGTGNIVNTKGGLFANGTFNNPAVIITASNTWNSVQDFVGGNSTGGEISCSGTCFIRDGSSLNSGSGPAIIVPSGGTLTLDHETLTSTSGVSLNNAGTVVIRAGNTFPQGITNTGTIQIISGEGGYQGACTGVVTSATTVGLYGLGQTAATTCTSTTVASGQVMSKSGTVYALYCTATAGNQVTDACTVVKNGAAQTMTCSLNGVASCTDGTVAHAVTFAQGDILGIEVIGGTTTTLANVKGTLVTN